MKLSKDTFRRTAGIAASRRALRCRVNATSWSRAEASSAMRAACGMIPSNMPDNDRTGHAPPWHPPGRVISKGAIALLMISPLLHIGEAIVAGVQGRDFGDLTFISPTNISLAGVFGAVDLATCILFCIWWYRAHQNLRFLGVEGLTYTPRAAVWAFFIPLIHLVRPERVAEELWRASNATTEGDRLQPSSWHSPAAARWWTCFVLAGCMRGCVKGEDGKPFGLIVVIAYVLLVFAATYAIDLIREIDRLQQQRFTAMQRSGASAGTMPAGAI